MAVVKVTFVCIMSCFSKMYRKFVLILQNIFVKNFLPILEMIVETSEFLKYLFLLNLE